MNTIIWKSQKDVIGATTIKDENMLEHGNMALHACLNEKDIITNRQQLAKQFKLDINSFVFANQTHSTNFKRVRASDCGKGVYSLKDSIDDCDALYTRETGITLGVFHADCVGILLYDPMGGIIAAIHAGYQGTLNQITTKLVKHLIKKEGMLPKHIHAYFSPSIAFNSYEVNNEIIEKVKAMDFDTSPYIKNISPDKSYLDLQGLNAQMLLNCGIKERHIRINKNDTYTNNLALFSYRRDHNCGRHLSFITMPQ